MCIHGHRQVCVDMRVDRSLHPICVDVHVDRHVCRCADLRLGHGQQVSIPLLHSKPYVARAFCKGIDMCMEACIGV